MCGDCCTHRKNWKKYLSDLGDFPDEVTEGCPNLSPPRKDGSRPCLIYDTHHDFWLKKCSGGPGEEETFYNVIKWFKGHPNCSFEFYEE
jgi:hypothetical protein